MSTTNPTNPPSPLETAWARRRAATALRAAAAHLAEARLEPELVNALAAYAARFVFEATALEAAALAKEAGQ